MVFIRSLSTLSGKGDISVPVVYNKGDPGLDYGAEQVSGDLQTVSKDTGASPNVDLESGQARKVKTGKQRFRFNLIFNLALWALVPLPFW